MKTIVRIILLGMLLGTGYARAEDKFSFEVKLTTKIKVRKAYLAYYSPTDEMIIDSAQFNKGRFRFLGKANGPFAVHLFLDQNNLGLDNIFTSGLTFKKIYLDEGINAITITDCRPEGKVYGSKIHDEYERYKAYTNANTDSLTKEIDVKLVRANLIQKKDPLFMNAIQKMYDEVCNERLVRLEQYITANPDSFFSLMALKELCGDKDISVIKDSFNRLSERLINSAAGREFAGLLAVSHQHWCDGFESAYGKS
jgi:hypothetical protein